MDKEKQAAKSAKKQKKRRSPILFFREVYGELKKVSWPTGAELRSAVFAVLAFTVIVAIIVGVLDAAFGVGLELIV